MIGMREALAISAMLMLAAAATITAGARPLR
jgi:hypothetical protein